MALTQAAELEFQGCNKFLHMILVQAVLDLDYVAQSWEVDDPKLRVGYTVYVREATRQWILCNIDDGITSFMGICRVLEIDPGEFRNRFRRKLYCRNEVLNGKATRVFNNPEDSHYHDPLSRSLVGSKVQL